MPSLREVYLRHARYYLHQLCAIEDEAKKGETEAQKSKKEFVDAWEQIQGAQAWADRNAGDDDAAALCSGYAAAISCGVTGATLLDFRQHIIDRMRWLETGLASARRLGDKRAESVHLYDLGVICIRNHDCKRGIECLEEVLALFRRNKDLHSEGVALNALSYAYRLDHRPRLALECVTQARTIFRDLGDKWDEAYGLCALGQIHCNLGEADAGIPHLQDAVAIFRDLGDLSGEVSALEDLGQNHLAIGDTDAAKVCFDTAVSVFRNIRNPLHRDMCASSMIAIGLAHVSFGEPRAVELLQEDLAVSRSMGNRMGEGFTLLALGWAYLNRSEPAAATKCHEEALCLFRAIKYRLGQAFALFHLGVVESHKENWNPAISLHKEALAAFIEAGSRRGEGDAAWNLSLAFDKLGQHAEAITWAEVARRIFEDTGHLNAEKVQQKLAVWRRS